MRDLESLKLEQARLVQCLNMSHCWNSYLHTLQEMKVMPVHISMLNIPFPHPNPPKN